MAKKNFSTGLDSLLQPTTDFNQSSDKENHKKTDSTSKVMTYNVSCDKVEKLKAIAYWDRRLIKDVVDEAFAEYILSYEKKNGQIKKVQDLK